MTAQENECPHRTRDLEEIRVGNAHFPVLFICKSCNATLTCTCFSGQYSLDDDVLRFARPSSDYPKPITIIEKAGICSMCTGQMPKLIYGHEMYYSKFLQRYLPYHSLLARKACGRDIYEGEPAYKQIEKDLRKFFGYASVGKKWLSETILFNTVKLALPNCVVVQHYRGRELEGLEIDIFVPQLRLGIEYQGKQHFKPVLHWGGEEGLKKRRSSDRKKKRLCRKLGYSLVCFHHRDESTDEGVRRKLREFIQSEGHSFGGKA
jgi:hypothetical protein